MATWTPDPTFYPSPRMAMRAPAEGLAYVAAFDPARKQPDGIAIVDVDPKSSSYSKIVGTVTVPNAGDEFHHFGWNACSSCLCPQMPHPHVERRYLVVPGLRSSRIYIFDTKPDPRNPKLVKTIEPQEIADKTGYSRPHTIHCGPGGIYVAALGNKDGKAPGGVFVMDPETFEPLGRWEVDRGRSNSPTMPGGTSATTPSSPANGARPTPSRTAWSRKSCSAANTAASCTSGTSPSASTCRRSTSARSTSWCSSCGRRTTRPRRTVSSSCVVSLKDLLVVDLDLVPRRRQVGGQEDHLNSGRAGVPTLPPVLKGFGACPAAGHGHRPVDGRPLSLRVVLGHRRPAAIRTSPIRSIPDSPARCASAASSRARAIPVPGMRKLGGGPQEVEVSRDGRRVYFADSLYGAIDPQLRGRLRRLDGQARCRPDGGIAFHPKFFVEWPKGSLPAGSAAGRPQIGYCCARRATC